MMALRERLLTTLQGGLSDRIPWNTYSFVLPASPACQTLHAKGLSLMDSRKVFSPLYDGLTMVERRKDVEGQTWFHTEIETPVGTLTEVATVEQNHGSRWIRKFFIAGPEDYGPAEYLFRHTSFVPQFVPWCQADAIMGDGGIVVGEIMPIPLVYLMVSWMGVEGTAEGMHLYTERFEGLLDALDRHYDRQVEIAADSPAEIIWFPDNVTGRIHSPQVFERYCAPVYARAMPIMRQAGKIPIAHYDGSNRPLVECIARTDLPVIEAFTPPPMGDLGVAEAKAAWPDKVVWVNFPGCYFLESAEAVEEYTTGLPKESAAEGRLVIGCTEDSPAAEFERTFSAIGRALARFEGVDW